MSTKQLGDFAASISVNVSDGVPSLNTIPASGDATGKIAPMVRVKEAADAASNAATAAANAQISADSVHSAGDFKWSARSTNHGKWLLADGKTVGSTASGATARANADTIYLYTVLWNEWSNAVLPIQTSTGDLTTRGVSAAADFAANKRMPLPDMRGLGVRGYHFGSAAYETETSRTLGSVQGDSLASHNHSLWGDVRQNFAGAGRVTTSGEEGLEAWVYTEYTGGSETRMRNRALATFIYLGTS